MMKKLILLTCMLAAAVLFAGCTNESVNDTVTKSEAPVSTSAPVSDDAPATATVTLTTEAPFTTSAASAPETLPPTSAAPMSEASVSISAAPVWETVHETTDETSITDEYLYEEYDNSDKEFTFESDAADGKKLLLTFTASPVEQGSDIYAADAESTSISVIAESAHDMSHITQTDVLRTPLCSDGTFLYHSDYDIQMKLLPCNDDGGTYLGLAAVPTGDGTYCTTLYVYRNLKFTIITDLFPEVGSIDDIILEGSKISFYDVSSGEKVSYRLDLSKFTSKKLPNTAKAISFDELETESKDKPELIAHPFHLSEWAAPGGGNPPIEYNGTTYEYHFNNGDYFIDKDKNVTDLGAYDNDWQLDPENKLDALMMKLDELEYMGRVTGEDLGLYTFDEAEMYKSGDNIIFIFNSESLPMHSANFRKVFFGFEYFNGQEAEILNTNPPDLKAVLSNRGIEYEPSIFLSALLYEKAVRVNGVLVTE